MLVYIAWNFRTSGITYAYGVLYVIGGTYYDGRSWERSGSVFRLEFNSGIQNTNQWECLPNIPKATCRPLIVNDGGNIYVIGK